MADATITVNDVIAHRQARRTTTDDVNDAVDHVLHTTGIGAHIGRLRSRNRRRMAIAAAVTLGATIATYHLVATLGPARLGPDAPSVICSPVFIVLMLASIVWVGGPSADLDEARNQRSRLVSHTSELVRAGHGDLARSLVSHSTGDQDELDRLLDDAVRLVREDGDH